MQMIKRKAFIHTIFTIILVTALCTEVLAQEKIIRYKRYEEPLDIINYFTIGGEYALDSEVFVGQAGLILDFRLSSTFFMSAEAFVVTEDFKRYSFNIGAVLNSKFMEGKTAPFLGAGISLHIPTSSTLSTEIVAKANIGMIIEENFRFTVYYTTPMDHLFDYSSVGASLGIQM
jgi:hypothetical protein